MNYDWQDLVDFHGHACPGLAYGVAMTKLAMEMLGASRDIDEELVAITETDFCGVDALEMLSGCTLGKGNLIYNNTGKQAFTLLRRSDGKGVRVYCDGSEIQADTREEKINKILSLPPRDFCTVREVNIDPPEKAQLFDSVCCSVCNEKLAENRALICKGQIFCRDCLKEYNRGYN